MSTVKSVESKSPPEVSSLAYVFDDASGNTIGFLEAEVAESTYVKRCRENHYVHNHGLLLRRHHAKT